MALRGRRYWLAIDGLGGPSYHSATPDRLQDRPTLKFTRAKSEPNVR